MTNAPIEVAEIEKLISDAIELDELHVKFDGSQCAVIAVADVFGELSRVKRQQAVYACLNEYIADGRLHAVSIVAKTPAEWQAAG